MNAAKASTATRRIHEVSRTRTAVMPAGVRPTYDCAPEGVALDFVERLIGDCPAANRVPRSLGDHSLTLARPAQQPAEASAT